VTIFDLPPYKVGPYRVKAVPVPRKELHWKRERYSLDFPAGIVNFDQALESRAALELYMRCLVKTVHVRSGLDNKSTEESFTQSLASGITELAHGDLEFWAAFNELLARILSPHSGWRSASLGGGRFTPTPKRIVFKNQVCKIVEVDGANLYTRHSCYAWYGAGWSKDCDIIELGDTLEGGHKAVIVLHEVLHFIHDCVGLRDRDSAPRFEREEGAALLHFLQRNPSFWRWWLQLAFHGRS
jgi:hypothetical protein